MAFVLKDNCWAALIMCIMLFSFGAVPSTAEGSARLRAAKTGASEPFQRTGWL